MVAQSSNGAPHTLNHTALSRLLPQTSLEIHGPGVYQFSYSHSSHYKRNFQITRSKTSYILIEPQPHPCTPGCGYEFYALPVYPQCTFTALLVGSPFGIRSEHCRGAFCRNSQRVKAIDCFCRRAPSLMFCQNSKYDSVWIEGFQHWGYTRKSRTPLAS